MRLRSIGVIAAVVAAAGLAAFVAAPAGAAGEFMKVAKQKAGPYRDEPFSVNVAAGKSKNLYLKVRPSETAAQDVLVENIHPDYVIKYFRGTQNVTTQVEGPGFFFDANKDRVRFRMRVKRPEAGPATDCVQLYNEDASLIIGFNQVCK